MSAGDEAVGAASTSSEFESLHEIVGKAHQVLPKEKWDSLTGGAESETTLKRNRLAIDSIAFKPRVLRNVSTVDLSIEHFGRKLRLPVFSRAYWPVEPFRFWRGRNCCISRSSFRHWPHAQLGLHAA